MEANKDAAEKCKRRGLNFMQSNQLEQALKWFEKAERLFPSLEGIDALKAKVHSLKHSRKYAKSTSRTSTGNTGSNTRNEQRTRSGSGKNSSSTDAEINRIKKSQDYYEILGVNKDCSSAELKKAYRKVVNSV